MSAFGWSLPPGCSRLPGDDESPCEVCGLWPNDCICPECPECSDCGNPKCYDAHGLTRSPEQVASLAREVENWRKLQMHEPPDAVLPDDVPQALGMEPEKQDDAPPEPLAIGYKVAEVRAFWRDIRGWVHLASKRERHCDTRRLALKLAWSAGRKMRWLLRAENFKEVLPWIRWKASSEGVTIREYLTHD